MVNSLKNPQVGPYMRVHAAPRASVPDNYWTVMVTEVLLLTAM